MIPKKVRGSSSYFASQKDQLFSSPSTFQDGNVSGCVTPTIESRLGSYHRPSGCLPACPDSSTLQTSSGLLLSGKVLPVSGSSFRPSRLPLGVLSVDSRRRCLSQIERDQNLLLPRRLAVGGEFKDSVRIQSSVYIRGDSGSGFPSKLGKIIPSPNSASVLSRSRSGYSQPAGSSHDSQSSGAAVSNSKLFSTSVCPSRFVAKTVGSFSQFYGPDSSVPSVDASVATSLPEVLLSSERSAFPSD